MKLIPMSVSDQNAFRKALDYVGLWCKTHQWEFGVTEMALGAALVAGGVKNGAIAMGRDLFATAFSHNYLGEQVGSMVGASVGGIGGALLQSIGVAAGGGAVGIPALLVIAGGAILLGAAGYAVGDLAYKFLNPLVNPCEFLANASLLALGVALLIDGARRVATDPRVLTSASTVKDGIIYLGDLAVEVVARTIGQLRGLEDRVNATGSIVACAAVGTVVGGSLATGSVTVLGSQAIGSIALSLGLVSAPLWPVFVCGAFGLSIGYAVWRFDRIFGSLR